MSETAEETRLYKVIFTQQGQTFEVFARGVGQGSLFGFVEIEELVFGERSQLVVDPSEDRLRNEFDGVRRFYVPIHSVIRIDEVRKGGVARVTGEKGDTKVRPFPVPIYTPSSDST